MPRNTSYRGRPAGISDIRRFANRRAPAKALKMTSVRGAYKKNRKKQINKRMRPMVETKKRLQSVIDVGTAPMGIPDPLVETQFDPGSAAYHTMLPWSFLSLNQGVTNDSMLGTNLYSRFLKQKFEFSFPLGTNTVGFTSPANYYLIHGFVTVPLNRTQYTTPTHAATNRSHFIDHVDDQVKQYFNASNDKLSFDSKTRTGVKILGYRRIKQQTKSITMPQMLSTTGYEGSTTTILGGVAPVYMSCNWPTKRKVHYTPGTASEDVEDTSFFYPNWSWIPFSLVYCPDFAAQQSTQGIKWKSDNAHYYSDS